METKRINKKENNRPGLIPFKEEIVFDDFLKMDLRVGEIKRAEMIKDSNKLFRFTVDIGMETRTIVSGVAKYFSLEEMVGKKVTVIVNLAPRKIMGILSQGMLLFAENSNGKFVLVAPGHDAENGATIR